MAGPELSFNEWCDFVCGPYRNAKREVLQSLWEKNYLPQQAYEHMKRKRLFIRRYRHEVPFWEAWKAEGAAKPRAKRKYTLDRFAIMCRLAEAHIVAIRVMRQHRLESADIQWLNGYQKKCALVLEERERRRREKKSILAQKAAARAEKDRAANEQLEGTLRALFPESGA